MRQLAQWCLLSTAVCIVFIARPDPLRAQTTDTLFAGSPSLGTVPLATGTDTIRSFTEQEGVRTPSSTTILTIETSVDDGTEVYHVGSLHISDDTTVTLIVVRKSDFALMHHGVRAPDDSGAVTVAGDRISGWVALPSRPVLLFDLQTDHPVLPVDGPAPWIVRLLPLREDYSAAVPSFSMWTKSERWRTYKVAGSEFVENGGRTFECWKVDGGPLGPPGYISYLWVEKSSRRIVQGALLNPDGGREYWSHTSFVE